MADEERIEPTLDPNAAASPAQAPGISDAAVQPKSKKTLFIIIDLMHSTGDIPQGETPHSVNLCAFDELVDKAKPGDRVQITGIYRAVPMRLKATQRSLRSVYKTYIDVIHYKKTEQGR